MTDRAEQLRKGKAAERQRRKDAGLVRVEVWVKPEDVAWIKCVASDLRASAIFKPQQTEFRQLP
jgi:hypothetical protein